SSQTPSNSSVAGYAYSGCYTDADTSLPARLSANSQYLLNGRSYATTNAMTWAACTSYCNGYQYAGLTSGSICRCGNSFNFSPTLNPDSLCQTPCTGDILQSCGASNRSTVF
ncbi:carbohydrate-binding WSC, partial [Lizonia empirigonia]